MKLTIDEIRDGGAGGTGGASDLRTGTPLTRAGLARDQQNANRLVGTQVNLPGQGTSAADQSLLRRVVGAAGNSARRGIRALFG